MIFYFILQLLIRAVANQCDVKPPGIQRCLGIRCALNTTSFRVPVGKLQKFTLLSVVKLAGRCSIDGAPVSFSADGGVPSRVITPTHQSKIPVLAAKSADRVLSSATRTALTRAAGEGRRQPCRGGRVLSNPRLASRVIRATGGPGFRVVPARCADGRLPVG